MQNKDRLRQLPANTRGRDYVVGDIHGYFFALERALAEIGFDFDRDRLLSVGDLIDRGPESHRAPEFVAEPWFHAVRGNHEQMLLNAVRGERGDPAMRALWYQNGGAWFEALGADAAAEIVPPLVALPHAMAVDQPDGHRIGLVHADLPTRNWTSAVAALAENDEAVLQYLVWSRQRASIVRARLDGRRHRRRVSVADVDRIFFGHTPMPCAIACGNTRWLDTGVFLPGGRLSIAALDDDSLWSFAVEGDDCYREWRVLADR